MSNIDVSRPDERNTELRSRVADEYRWASSPTSNRRRCPRG